MDAQSDSGLYPTSISWPPKLSKEQLAHLLSEIKDWSIARGLAVRPQTSFVAEDVDPTLALATTAPVTLFPSLLPRRQYEQARGIQKVYNELYAHIASEPEWIREAIEQLLPYDSFIANLWQIHQICQEEGYAQPLSLGLFRSDYMIHQDNDPSIPPASLRQVEFNTIASSFGGLAAKVSEMHYHLRTHEAYPDNVNRILSPEALPANPSIQGLAKGLVAAHRAYGSSLTEQTQQCILVTVQDPERNTFDQKHIEYEVQRQGARIFRLPFDRVLEDTFLVPEKEQALVYTPPAFPYRAYEVTTIYYRAGYAPSEYEKHYIPSKPEIETQAWQARLQLERSRAIKCPSVLTHLAGCKKVQQILATPGSNHLSRFLRSGDLVDTIRETFMPILPLDESPAGQAGRKLALDPQACQRYVLKPQREGGGNNIYRSKIPDFLRSQDETAWSQYILMEMIETPAQRNVILRNGETMEGGVICELGCYGAVIWNAEGQTLFNEELGTLMRTKGDQSEEGGVAAGFGAVDSPVLINV